MHPHHLVGEAERMRDNAVLLDMSIGLCAMVALVGEGFGAFAVLEVLTGFGDTQHSYRPRSATTRAARQMASAGVSPKPISCSLPRSSSTTAHPVTCST